MVAALIQFTQGGNVGTPGQALYGVVSVPVTVANANDAGVEKWVFTVVDAPPSSALVPGQVQAGTTPTWTWTPDTTDMVEVRLDVYDASNNLAGTDSRCFGVKRPSTRIIPSFTAIASALNFGGATRGWASIMEAWLNFLDGLTNGGGGGGSTLMTVAHATTSSANPIAGNSFISGLKVKVDTPFNAGTLALGNSSNASLLLAAGAIDVVGCPAGWVYDISPTTFAAWGASTLALLATVAGAASGSLRVFVTYSTPLN